MTRALLLLALLATTGLAADATHVIHQMKLGDLSFPGSVTKIGEKNLTTHKTETEDPGLKTEHGWDIQIAPQKSAAGTIQATVTARHTQPATQDKSQATAVTTSTATTYTFTLPADQRDHTLKLGATPITLKLTPTTASGEPVTK